MIEESRGLLTPEAAETLAAGAFFWLSGQPEALGRFFLLTGSEPSAVHAMAADPGFLAGVLDFLAADEALLVACAGHAGIPPERLNMARRILNRHD